jgi:hypothetical protein
MTNRMLIFTVSNLIAAAALSLAYGLEQFWVGSIVALGLGLWSWLGMNKFQGAWSANLFFGGVVLLVTIGSLLDLIPYLLFIAILGALGAWDLIRFQKRIEHSPKSEGILQIEKRHLKLLGITFLIGGTLAGVLVTVRMQISFGVALVLGVILIITLGEIIRAVRN